jgi:hypothetical protein
VTIVFGTASQLLPPILPGFSTFANGNLVKLLARFSESRLKAKEGH